MDHPNPHHPGQLLRVCSYIFNSADSILGTNITTSKYCKKYATNSVKYRDDMVHQTSTDIKDLFEINNLHMKINNPWFIIIVTFVAFAFWIFTMTWDSISIQRKFKQCLFVSFGVQSKCLFLLGLIVLFKVIPSLDQSFTSCHSFYFV